TADLQHLRTILGSLIRNAIDAAPQEGWVSVRAEKSDGDCLQVVVEDNGPGPAPEIREHLFDPFYSGRSAGRGRGLGLSTAWRLAQHNGGDVSFDTSAGVTRFILSLPRALVPNALPSHNGHAIEANNHVVHTEV